MTAQRPTILATSGGYRPGERTQLEFDALVHHAVERAGVTGRAPRVCVLSTGCGDFPHLQHQISEAGRVAGFDLTHLTLFPMPNVPDLREHVLSQDVVWAHGGSVANLLAVWRVHELDTIFREAWEAGVVLSGVSAGSICWHVGGTTDSFGHPLRAVTNGLALLPYGNGVHYDSEAQRRPLVQGLVADGTLPQTYCTDDGVGIVYEGTEVAEVVSELPGKAAWHVTRVGDAPREERLEPRLLSGGAG